MMTGFYYDKCRMLLPFTVTEKRILFFTIFFYLVMC